MRYNSFLLFFLLTTCVAIGSIAQPAGNKLPPFKMMQPNGKWFKAQDLPMGKPIIIIYFEPDCDHCQAMVTELMSRINDFKTASIAMITYYSPDAVEKFSRQYNLDKHSNIHTGTEGATYFVRDYFRIVQLPFVALYNKNGDYQTSYSRQIPLDDITKRLKQLK